MSGVVSPPLSWRLYERGFSFFSAEAREARAVEAGLLCEGYEDLRASGGADCLDALRPLKLIERISTPRWFFSSAGFLRLRSYSLVDDMPLFVRDFDAAIWRRFLKLGVPVVCFWDCGLLDRDLVRVDFCHARFLSCLSSFEFEFIRKEVFSLFDGSNFSDVVFESDVGPLFFSFSVAAAAAAAAAASSVQLASF
uniref:Uncharacterized protein n=1 Tax=uncultured prokaryote TaxID=198431 RepID=A0A0H5Q5Q9_9ZZZZ|nr:hypothetical protein [uncultured prokaryote]